MFAEPVPARSRLTVSEVAEQSGVAPSAIRFYEKHGLIHAERTAGNQRRFRDSAPCYVRVARVAQRVGLTVREIAAILDRLPDEPSPADWQIMEDTLIAEAGARIAAMRAVLDDLGRGDKLCEL